MNATTKEIKKSSVRDNHRLGRKSDHREDAVKHFGSESHEQESKIRELERMWPSPVRGASKSFFSRRTRPFHRPIFKPAPNFRI